jgi:hypothetical protein
LKHKVNQSGTYKESYRYNPLFDAKENYERVSETSWKEPMAWITGGYKVEVYKEGYLPNEVTVSIKANEQTFKEAFRNVKSQAVIDGPQTSYTGNRELLISLTPSPASSQSSSIAQQQ